MSALSPARLAWRLPMLKKSVQLSGVVVAQSAISSIDPDKSLLMYRGYDIAELAEHDVRRGHVPPAERRAAVGRRARILQGTALSAKLPGPVASHVDQAGSA